MENAPIIYFVVPCYNEEEVLPLTAGILGKKLVTLINAGVIGEESRILLVDDGSRDGTWKLIENLNREDGYFLGLKLSRNRGHQNALLAGLSEAARHCDAAISLDADLQDDVDACDQMIERFKAGCDIVYGVRKKRTTDSAFKRLTAEGFYKLMNLLGANTVYNHADFRLMSRRALKGLKEFTEVNLFLRGIVPMIGYPSDVVYYDRREQVSSRQDACFCNRGNYFPQHKTDQADYICRDCVLFCQHWFSGLGGCGFLQRKYGKRLGQYHGFHLVYRRSAFIIDWNRGRIYRKDISGDKAEAQIFSGNTFG